MEVRRLIQLRDAESGARERVCAAIKANGDIVMSMYADLERLTENH